MRVLFVNWVDWADALGRGGGVAVYQRNLARALHGSGVQAVWLSSGLAHDLRGGAPRWQALGRRPGHYTIANSAVLAPGQLAWGSPAQLSDPATEAAFADFLAATGPYDAVQFDNIEGLPAGVLAVARATGARVVVALHNYYPFCPQVNLWHRERETCPGFDQGRACVTCLPGSQTGAGARRAALAVLWQAERLGGPRLVPLAKAALVGARAGLGLLRGLRRRPAADPAAPAPVPGAEAAAFAARRAGMVAAINAHADRVLCVSDRVRMLAAAHGLTPALLQTARIGTPEAARFDRTRARPALTDAQGHLRLAYLGYMRRDKGFFFLLDALEALPEAMAARLHLTVAARRGPPEAMARLEALRARLAGLVHVDGYTHDQLDGILSEVTLGVVPVLWEDNLPQVALEMHLRGIALLTSDLGGAQELGNCPDLVFPAGNAAAFADRIGAALDGRIDLGAYWAGARAPETMERHLAVLHQVWQPH
ncbi:glycosyltransferase [Gemmobacter nectariphilus]|uniref:glycosyltransferase n=1 Tax=Gemmobacter nectariphilus TaxID=220343 RepID=UPI0003FC8C10|nr:glycosyltransferase [Gemmobacter nectariphilus]